MAARPSTVRCVPAVLGLMLVAVLVSACTVGPSVRPPVAVRGDGMVGPVPVAPSVPPGPPELPVPEPGRADLVFVDCTEEILSTFAAPPPPDRPLRIECTDMDVPRDPDDPTQFGTRLQVLRVVGQGAAGGDRPPLVVVGDSATAPSARHAVELAQQVPLVVLESYDVVGIDRRGSGFDPLDCAPSFARAALADADPEALDEASLGRLLDRARDIVQECALERDGNLAPYRSASTARDLEELRIALGVRRLSALGVGDGAAAVAGWAGAAPDGVGRVVLDGPPQTGLDDPDLTDTRTRSTEAAFDAFAAACAAQPTCPLGPDPRSAVTGLVTSLQARPLASRGGDRLTAGTALLAIRTGLSEPRTWGALASGIAAAGAGDAGPLLTVLDPVLGPRGTFDGALATACNDSSRRLAPAQAAEFATRMRDTYPLFGGAMALHVVACAPWPTGGPAPRPASGVLPPILVLGTAADPRSTLDGARRFAQETPNSVFVSWQGAGTGAFPRTPCVAGVVAGMLVDATMPVEGTLCPP